MTTDPAFPLYRVVYWYDTGEGSEVETTSLMRPWMFKVDPGAEEVERQARDVWPTINWRGETVERRLLRIVVERQPDEPWALAWFAHQTFRAGRTDDELRESFERYVRQYEDMQDYVGDPPPGYRCLMGAEDRWRWKPFCECESCMRDDVALVAH